VDGPKVTVDYYSAVVNPTYSGGEYLISATPTLVFTHKDRFGYSLNGHEFKVAQASPTRRSSTPSAARPRTF